MFQGRAGAKSWAGENAMNYGRSVAKVYTQCAESFKDFIFGRKLLLLALMAQRVHRKR
jgi:hypothetical protein